jgi:hypothetical protein
MDLQAWENRYAEEFDDRLHLTRCNKKTETETPMSLPRSIP